MMAMRSRGTTNPPLVASWWCLVRPEANTVACASCLLIHREVNEFVRLLDLQAFNGQATHKNAYRVLVECVAS